MIRETVSILIPAYNMGRDIGKNIDTGVRIFSKFLSRFEMILCDDGSTDDTRARMQAAAKKHGKRVRVVGYPKNRGKGHALKCAFAYATGSYIVFCDADMELDPGQIERFFSIMNASKADIVIGSKWHPESKVNYSWQRRIISKLYFLFVKVFFRLPVRDTQTGLKLFKRDVLARVFPRILVKAFAYDLEVLAVAHHEGYRIVDAPVDLRAIRNFKAPRLSVLRDTLYDTLAVFYRLVLTQYYRGLFPGTSYRPLVSIIIPIKSVNEYIRQTVRHILAGAYQRFEIIILPDTKDGFSSSPFSGARVRIIETGPIPPAHKRDIGARRAKGEILAFIDDDTYPEADWLINAVRAFAASKAQSVGGPAPTAIDDDFWQLMSGAVFSSFLVSGNYRYRYMPGRVRSVTDYPSCNLLVRRSFYRSIGGFDSKYWPGEDTIFCQKIVDAGERILYTPEACVQHHRRRLFFGHFKQLSSYAYHRGYFIRTIGGNSLSFSYVVPTLFTVYLASLPIAMFFPVRLLWSVPLICYVVLLTASSLLTLSPKAAVFKFIGIAMSHAAYGVNFIRGFLKLTR